MKRKRALLEYYIGVDLAGDDKKGKGSSSVARISRVKGEFVFDFPNKTGKAWSERAGLERIAELARTSRVTAVDQPFSWSAETLKLIICSETAKGNTNDETFFWRNTDRAMKNLLEALQFPKETSHYYIVSPNQCINIWRALALARIVGFSREQVCRLKTKQPKFIETHPRLAIAVLLSYALSGEKLIDAVRRYKETALVRRLLKSNTKRTNTKASKAESEANAILAKNEIKALRTARNVLIKNIDQLFQVKPLNSAERDFALKTSDNIEALICAVVAFLFERNRAHAYLTKDFARENLVHEGAAVLPNLKGGKAVYIRTKANLKSAADCNLFI